MIYTEDDIKQDLLKTNVKEFYMKYLLRADNWYFERILNIDEKDIIGKAWFIVWPLGKFKGI